MRRSAPVRQANGFTLLELLVALTVLGFLLVGLAQGVHFGLLAWRAGVRLTNSNDDFNTLDGTLRHLIEGADPGDDLDPAPFVGSSDRLDCITALPSVGDPTGSRRMQATLLVDSRHRLVLRWLPYLHAKRVGPSAAADGHRIAARCVTDGAGILASRRWLGQCVART